MAAEMAKWHVRRARWPRGGYYERGSDLQSQLILTLSCRLGGEEVIFQTRRGGGGGGWLILRVPRQRNIVSLTSTHQGNVDISIVGYFTSVAVYEFRPGIKRRLSPLYCRVFPRCRRRATYRGVPSIPLPQAHRAANKKAFIKACSTRS